MSYNVVGKAGVIAAAALMAMASAACSTEASQWSTGSGDPQPIQFSRSCDDTCQQALTFSGDQNSVNCKVGISQNSLKHPYGVAQKAAMEEAAKKLFPKMQFIVTDGQGDAMTQSSQVRDLATRDIDVLVITPLDQDSLTPVVKEVRDAGVKVVTHDRTVTTPVDVALQSNNVRAGETAAQYLVDRLGPDGGNVVEITGTLGASATNERHEGFTNVISKHPNIKVVASQTADYQRDLGLTVMQDFLQRFPSGQIDAVFSHNDDQALGAMQAIDQAGRAKEMFLVGFDGQEQAFDAIKQGSAFGGTVVYPLNAPEAIVAAAKLCVGEQVPEVVDLFGNLVTSKNIDEYLGTGF